MQYIAKQYDLVVVGGGVWGVVTAVTAARKGLQVALVDNKAGLGGNACSEIGVSIDGATFFGFFANRTISSIRLVFDTDLDMPHPAATPVDYVEAVHAGGRSARLFEVRCY